MSNEFQRIPKVEFPSDIHLRAVEYFICVEFDQTDSAAFEWLLTNRIRKKHTKNVQGVEIKQKRMAISDAESVFKMNKPIIRICCELEQKNHIEILCVSIVHVCVDISLIEIQIEFHR